MNRLHILIIALFTVALGTGIVVGLGMTHVPPPHDGRLWLKDQLGLTPTQNQQLKDIWENVNGASQKQDDARRQSRKDRDEAFQALLTSDQKIAYAKIVEHYNQQIAQLNTERENEMQSAMDKTKALLNPHQQAVYEDWLKKGFHGGPGGRPGGPQGGPQGGPGGMPGMPGLPGLHDEHRRRDRGGPGGFGPASTAASQPAPV